MIGRDQELRQLNAAVEKLVNERQGSFIAINGEAEIGKSRLLAELIASLSPRQVMLLKAQSRAYQQQVSYWLILDLLRNNLGVTTEEQETDLRGKLAFKVNQVMGTDSKTVLPYLEHLLSIPSSAANSSDHIYPLEPEKMRQQIFLAMRDFYIAQAKKQPIVMILEDLHWADRASLDLLQFLLTAILNYPILVIAVARPYEQGSLERMIDWARNTLGDSYIPISLDMLSPDQSSQLLHELLAMPALPADFREQVLQRATGVPLYMEEILRMLIDKQYIKREQRLEPGARHRYRPHWRPQHVEQLDLSRFDRLNNIERRILQIASVIGQYFTVPLIKSVFWLSAGNEHWDELSLLISFPC